MNGCGLGVAIRHERGALFTPQLEQRLLVETVSLQNLLDEVHWKGEVDGGKESACNQLVKVGAGSAEILKAVDIQTEKKPRNGAEGQIKESWRWSWGGGCCSFM